MTNYNNSDSQIPNFLKSEILNGFCGILELMLILTSVYIYVENIIFLTTCLSLVFLLFFIMYYTLIFKNPFYYIACLGLIFITVFPTTPSLIIAIADVTLVFDSFRYVIIAGLIVEIFYVFFIIIETRHNKYISYFHKRYGFSWSGRATLLYRLYYSNKEFNKLDKGRQYWQDHDPEELEKLKEDLKAFNRRFKKKFLTIFEITIVISYIILFGIALIV